jgi:endonuclease/exonuclease/phosphatase (EEP) superfamily protein YafD
VCGVVVASARHKGHRRLVLLSLCAVNLLLVLAVAGRAMAISDLMAPLTGHFLGIGLAASLALLTRRLSLLLAGTLATFLAHAGLGVASCCRPPPAPVVHTSALSNLAPPGASDLSLLALNTWHRHGDLARLAAYLARADVDLMLLSEFGPNKRGLLKDLKASHPHQVGCAGEGACSLALLSRLPLESAGAGHIGSSKLAFVWARLGGVTVIGTQLVRPMRDPWWHQRQMAELVEFIGRIPGPVILAGDLNTTPWSSSYRALRRGAGLLPARRLNPTWPAWPLAFPQLALDHIFVSSDLSVRAAGTGPAVGSDHLPIWAVVERRPAFDRGKTLMRALALGSASTQPQFGRQLLADFGGEHGGARNLRR